MGGVDIEMLGACLQTQAIEREKMKRQEKECRNIGIECLGRDFERIV